MPCDASALSQLPMSDSVELTTCHLRCAQVRFLSMAFDGPDAYQGRFNVGAMALALAHLIQSEGLGMAEFDLFLAHLLGGLRELHEPAALIEEVAVILEPLRGAFLPTPVTTPSSQGG